MQLSFLKAAKPLKYLQSLVKPESQTFGIVNRNRLRSADSSIETCENLLMKRFDRIVTFKNCRSYVGRPTQGPATLLKDPCSALSAMHLSSIVSRSLFDKIRLFVRSKL